MKPVIDNNKVQLPPGAYVVGDPCYVVPDDSWCALLGDAGALDNFMPREVAMCGAFKTHDGREAYAVMFSTEYGDGVYSDGNGRDYSVDAGMIGIVRVDDVDPEALREAKGLSHVVVFAKPFLCYRTEFGGIGFGNLLIETGDSE